MPNGGSGSPRSSASETQISEAPEAEPPELTIYTHPDAVYDPMPPDDSSPRSNPVATADYVESIPVPVPVPVPVAFAEGTISPDANAVGVRTS